MKRVIALFPFFSALFLFDASISATLDQHRIFLPSVSTTDSSRTTGPIAVPFVTQLPGTTLPSGARCASLVPPSSWKPRPENERANNYIPVKHQDYTLHPWSGVDDRANREILSRVDGNFTGTTDEILQWAACKWGVDEDIVRALATRESWWYQSTVGDNGTAFGILQLKSTVFTGSWPASEKSTAFNVDYVLARWRACYEGWITYMGEGNSGYQAGDLWGCIGAHYSGQYRDAEGQWYMDEIKETLEERPWEQPGW